MHDNSFARVFPRRKRGEPGCYSKGRDGIRLGYEDITGLFHMRQTEAAKYLGISLTTMKSVCRRVGITRWPYSRQRDRAGSPCSTDSASSDEAHHAHEAPSHDCSFPSVQHVSSKDESSHQMALHCQKIETGSEYLRLLMAAAAHDGDFIPKVEEKQALQGSMVSRVVLDDSVHMSAFDETNTSLFDEALQHVQSTFTGRFACY
ncbi:hypothetical protein GUITHDRAFT_155982 [Guillardia theta CCMP2712]|uniref:RWP-RK domain-containing protein n=2 Tax=Guillardia theta TaxID=55529 RepID=L1IBK4_GUITC|nr:hypothetical protein GUITHDRAFT_155982 [Guillardia theta CCMP2712]EKX33618.1 hypothetical protein GUITHDRAFT_155982 [Guillardia theta CCMP2712]|mmetsp:Transcript_984/g.3112  ORF Transcript_984/g.3112 Transcript_984/m.3112 type:complete len:204 (+) Transcript_984:203-814(+)|eukprot:XP_005820598.1 hypothetical protein GUITHDRAFT_155982 [Guillardia theta CCMP2712]